MTIKTIVIIVIVSFILYKIMHKIRFYENFTCLNRNSFIYRYNLPLLFNFPSRYYDRVYYYDLRGPPNQALIVNEYGDLIPVGFVFNSSIYTATGELIDEI